MASMDFTRFLKVCNRRRKGESFRTAVLFLFVAVQLCGGIYPDRPIRYNSFRLKQVSGSVSFHVRTHVQIHMCDCLRSSIKDIFQTLIFSKAVSRLHVVLGKWRCGCFPPRGGAIYTSANRQAPMEPHQLGTA